jgi:hypothetical protein
MCYYKEYFQIGSKMQQLAVRDKANGISTSSHFNAAIKGNNSFAFVEML